MTTFRLIQLHNLIKKHGFIAGGACRSTIAGEEIKDFDIFCFTEEDYEPLKKIMSNMYGETRENDLVFQVGSIQLVKPRQNDFVKTFGSPREVVSKFDFSVCRVYTLDGTRFIWLDDEFQDDIQNKRLRIKNIICPISTFKRVIKYAKRGYYINTFMIVHLFNNFRNIDSSDDFFKQLDNIMNESEESDETLYEFLRRYHID